MPPTRSSRAIKSNQHKRSRKTINNHTSGGQGGNTINNNNTARIDKKRKREESSGGTVVETVTVAPSRPNAAKSTANPPQDEKVPESWRRIFAEARDEGKSCPPPSAILKLGEIRSDHLIDFHSAQSSVAKAMAANDKFKAIISAGEIPSVVSNAVRLPALQPLKGVVNFDFSAVPAFVEAKAAAERDIAAAVASSTKFVTEYYEAQLAEVRKQLNVTAAVTSGTPLLDRLCELMTIELETLNFEYVALLKRDADAKTAKAKAAAVSIGHADAEMADATKPIAELIKEAVGVKYKALEKEVQKLKGKAGETFERGVELCEDFEQQQTQTSEPVEGE
ncbi:hypothetical protein MSAN_02051800 [Mycena sanguinolenta]|uniref:Uncharacterized protein n=1 Tax=Mycena sanguinolenta TaxID=230812 RepID=A0A8H6XJ13_9AGAR|nr:hypothetical protein MSAN_02051800 [Mycena sanguinolenta]